MGIFIHLPNINIYGVMCLNLVGNNILFDRVQLGAADQEFNLSTRKNTLGSFKFLVHLPVCLSCLSACMYIHYLNVFVCVQLRHADRHTYILYYLYHRYYIFYSYILSIGYIFLVYVHTYTYLPIYIYVHLFMYVCLSIQFRNMAILLNYSLNIHK